jgi:hypothetical protein
MNIDEFRHMIVDANFIGTDVRFDLTMEEVPIVFTGSKLITAGEIAADVENQLLTFVDFLEAITRLTEYKQVVPQNVRKRALAAQVSGLVSHLIERLRLQNPAVGKRTKPVAAPRLPNELSAEGHGRGKFRMPVMPKGLTEMPDVDLTVMQNAMEQVFMSKQLKAATMVQSVWRGRNQRWKGNTPKKLFYSGINKVASRTITMSSEKVGLIDEFSHSTTTTAKSKYSRRTTSALVQQSKRKASTRKASSRRLSTMGGLEGREGTPRARKNSQKMSLLSGHALTGNDMNALSLESVPRTSAPRVLGISFQEREEAFLPL